MSDTVRFKFAMGLRVKDSITGYIGIVVTRADYISGCIHYGLQTGVNEKGEVQSSEFFEESRLSEVDKGVSADYEKKIAENKGVGGPVGAVSNPPDRR